MANDFKLSVILEAVTAAFNSNIKEAAQTFSKAEATMAAAASDGAKSAVAAADAVTRANEDVKPPASFASFFTAIKEGWAEGVAEARASTTGMAEAAEVAGSRINDLGKQIGGVAESSRQVGAAIAESLNLPTVSTAQLTRLKEAIYELDPAAAKVGSDIAESLNVKSLSVAQVDKLKSAINELDPAAAKVGTDIELALALKKLSPIQIEKLKTSIGTLDPVAQKAGAAVEVALALRNLSPAQIEKLKASIGSLVPAAAEAGRGIKSSISELGPQAEKSGKEVEKGLTLGGLVKSVGAIVTVKEALQALIANAVQLQQVTNQLTFATGGVAQGAAAYAFLRDTANSLGLSLEASAKGFAQLAASTKGTQLEGKATRDLFLGISQAAATMGLSVEDTNGVFNALSQIASKGTVQMEELRGQLGDRLPGVLKIAADSMGVTVAELNNLVGSGLDANQFLKNFGPALQQAFSAQAAENLKTLGGQIAVLKNQFFELLSTINASGAGSGLTVLTHDLGEALKNLGQLFREASGSPDFQAFNEVLVGTYSTIRDDIVQLASTGAALFDTLDTVFKAITGIASTLAGGDLDGHQLGLLESVLAGVNISLGLLGDGLKGLEIAFLSVSAIAQSSFGLIALTAGKIAGVVNKELGQSLTDLGDKLLKGANDSADKATQKMLTFTSGAAKAFDNLAAAADKANATLDPSKQLSTAEASLKKYLDVAKQGTQPVLEIQAQADTLSAAFKNLYDKGAIGATQLRQALDRIKDAIPPAKAATEDFLSAIIKLGSEKAANFSALTENLKEVGATLKGDLTQGVAEALVSFAKLGDSASTSSRNVRLSFTNLVNQAQTATDIDAVIQAFGAMRDRGKITGDDVGEALRQIGDQALKLKTVLPQSISDALASVGAKTNEELSRDAELAQRYVDRVAQLVRDNKVSTDALNTAIVNAANAAAAGVQKALSFAGAATVQQLAAQITQARNYVDQIVEEYKKGNVKIQAVLDAQQKLLDLQQTGIQKALDAVGVKSNAQLQAAVDQAKANLNVLTEAAGRNEVRYTAVAAAQRLYADAIAATIPGATTLADVEKRLADQDAQEIERKKEAAVAQDAYNKKLKETKPAVDEVQIVGAQLNNLFGSLVSQLKDLSAAAANNFGQRLGIQFGFIEGAAGGAEKTIGQLREEMNNLVHDTLIAGDFGSIATKMRDIQIAADGTKIAFLEQKQQVDAYAQSIDKLATSGTASLGELEKAAKMGVSSTTLLGEQDLSHFRSALDAAKNRIDEIKNASLSAADALHAMGDSLQIEILRAQGNNVAAIQAEADAQAAGIDAQIKALGANASEAAKAEALRAKQLLAQATAQKVAEQKASDAAAAATKKAAVIPPQAVPPVTPSVAVTPTTTTAPTGKQITLRFEDASGKASTVTAPSTQAADDLLAILTRAGATNITKQGA